jgi:hypothetical protein
VILPAGLVAGALTTLTAAVPVAPPFVACAVMTQDVGEDGAVYNPALVIVPQVVVQVTGKLAVNVSLARTCIVTDNGETATASTLAVPEPVEFEPSCAVAVTIQVLAVAGAVKVPTDETEPQVVVHATVVPLEVVELNSCVPDTGTFTVNGETVTTVPVGMLAFRVTLVDPPAVSVMSSEAANAPTVAELNRTTTVQVPEPATGVELQVSENLLNLPEPDNTTVGVTDPVPRLVAVIVVSTLVEMVVAKVREVGEMDSGISVTWPEIVAVAVVPPLTAVAVIVQVPFVEGAVYRPEPEIVPQFADHDEVKLPVNCCVPPTRSPILDGVTVSA